MTHLCNCTYMLNYFCYQYSDLEEYNVVQNSNNDVTNSNNTKVITTPPSIYNINNHTLNLDPTNKSNVAYNTFSDNDSISNSSSSDDSWENISDDDLTR